MSKIDKIVSSLSVAVLVLASLPVLLPHKSQAAFPGTNGVILYANIVGAGELATINPDGSNDTLIPGTFGGFTSGKISPDGTRLLTALLVGSDVHTFTMDLDGSNPLQVTSGSNVSYLASWSPDGTKIVFVSSRDEPNGNIYTANTDGSNVMRLTTDPAGDGYPVWSPDGSKISFNSARDGDFELYTMNPDGSNQTNITNNGDTDGVADWSPDGNRLIFYSDRGGTNDIYTMNPDGSDATLLIGGPDSEFRVVWSPDGEQVAFTRNTGGFNYGLFVANSDGSNEVQLIDPSGNDAVVMDWQAIPVAPSPTPGSNGSDNTNVQAVPDTGIPPLTKTSFWPFALSGLAATTLAGLIIRRTARHTGEAA